MAHGRGNRGASPKWYRWCLRIFFRGDYTPENLVGDDVSSVVTQLLGHPRLSEVSGANLFDNSDEGRADFAWRTGEAERRALEASVRKGLVKYVVREDNLKGPYRKVKAKKEEYHDWREVE